MVNSSVFPLDQERIFYCSFARGALYCGILGLGLKSGDEVLLPEYICNVVCAPFHEAGIQIVYYRIKKDLTPDWGHVKACAGDRTRAFLLVNYFGFPNDLERARDFCDTHKLFFIEDNAHGFLSHAGTRPLGSWGDISIFAFHKTVFLPGGAALVINKNAPFDQTQMSLRRAPFVGWFLLKNFLARLRHLAIKRLNGEKLVRQIHPTNTDRAQEYDVKDFLVKMPSWSRHVLAGLDPQKERQTRRKRYQYWFDYFKKQESGVRPLFSDLGAGVCPQVFPVYVSDRAAFIRAMALEGIASFAWPYMPHDSKENDFSQHVVCLPVC